MKRKYRIIIEGKAYEVEVEELEAEAAIPVQSRSTTRSSVATEPVVRASPTTSVSRPPPRGASVISEPKITPPPTTEPTLGEGTVTAPIPGTVIRVDFKTGDSVSQGDVLLILEAMKMENEIIAPNTGKIKKIVSPNTTVNFGDVLCIIE